MQDVLGLVAEQNLGCLDGHLIVLLTVCHDGDLASQSLLQRTLTGVLRLLGLEGGNLVLGQVGEDFDILSGILVADVEPELVELVWRGALGVKPHIAALGLAKLGAVGLGDERAGDGEGLTAIDAANQLGTRGDVAPLVAATHLQAASLGLIEVQIVVALQQLVAELGERHAVVGIGGQTFLDRVLGHHVVDGDVLADVADEVEEAVALHPVIVVDQDGVVGRITVKVQELGQLLADALLVVAQGVLIDEHALLRLHRRVANHACGSANQGDGPVSGTLQVLEHHDAHQVANVQRVGCGVDAHIARGHLLVELFFGSGHDVVDHAAPFQFFYKIYLTHR